MAIRKNPSWTLFDAHSRGRDEVASSRCFSVAGLHTGATQDESSLEADVVILADGTIGSVRVAQGLASGLNEKAIECVRQWKFVPGGLEGRPVDVIAIIVIQFKIF